MNYNHTKKEKILKPRKTPNGYLQVGIGNKGKTKHLFVHRLVAEAFIPNPENKPQVNHLSGNKLNNEITNLEWVSASENMKHAWKSGLCIVTIKFLETTKIKGINNSKKVLQYDLQGNFIKEWESATKAGETLKLNNSSISACCRGKNKTAGGYVWKYKDTQ